MKLLFLLSLSLFIINCSGDGDDTNNSNNDDISLSDLNGVWEVTREGLNDDIQDLDTGDSYVVISSSDRTYKEYDLNVEDSCYEIVRDYAIEDKGDDIFEFPELIELGEDPKFIINLPEIVFTWKGQHWTLAITTEDSNIIKPAC